MASLRDLLNAYREGARSMREMGAYFERLARVWLESAPTQAGQFHRVLTYADWAKEFGKDGRDVGIDLCAQLADDPESWCAVQCKFYGFGYRIRREDIDSFFTASGKKPFVRRIIIDTTDARWSEHAESALENQNPPASRIGLSQLEESGIDWATFVSKGKVQRQPKKTALKHQNEAIEAVLAGLQDQDRGKLIMACGTGKTFTALKIVEKFAKAGGRVLYLVPSLALMSQTVREWSIDADIKLRSFAVCSDSQVGKRNASDDDLADLNVHDLEVPATTKAGPLTLKAKENTKDRLTVFFSTYQSIQVISEAQKSYGLPQFDMIVCDEAHRTTGVTLADADESHFVKVHDADYIKARKRLYMTATPRIYMDATKSKAKEAEAELCSMDDEALYGRELHRLGFGEAISRELLADYKVMVLAVDEKFVSKTFQQELAAASKAKGKAYDDYFTDLVKITGCWNGLGKRMAQGDAELLAADTAPMRRAVAFSRSIAASKQLKNLFASIVDKYIEQVPEDQRGALLRCEVDHVDGTMNALERGSLLDWLKRDATNAPDQEGANVCRILTNARCLSEGVDVPSLDAVLFLNPRNSVVDVVQAVGRVMRRAPGKKYGYIILPIGIPADTAPEEALKDNEKYKVIWQTLQALRSHDERIEAAINQIDLTGKKPANISIIGVTGGAGNDDEPKSDREKQDRGTQFSLDFPNLGEWRDAIFARIVLKVGDRRYWESWAKEVAGIATAQISRIKGLLEADGKAGGKARAAFDKFLTGLRGNLNPTVSEGDAIEMLAQHLITQPVFDALFKDYEFTQNNPVSKSMQRMLDILRNNGLAKEPAALQKFYESVRQKAGIDIEGLEPAKAAEARQRIVIELYDKFFRTAFAKMSERLGIVYTPVEVVDFILKSADYALKEEFGVGLTGSNVHVLDPFTGTGTFIVRLLQGGLISAQDLERKFKEELHANEIVLLAYYIAAVNIEYAYHLTRSQNSVQAKYQPFEGIVLTDTFQLTEGKGAMEEAMFPDNNRRARKQKAVDIRVVVGNPPYSAQQDSENDDNKNMKYPNLDERIRSTYAAQSDAGLLKNLYDSYVRAIRWASDRIKDKGIVCYVTNGSFIDANNMDGLRKTLLSEFSRVYVFNLRGNQRTSGEQSRKEGGKVFGSGSRATVAITLLVKDSAKPGDGSIRYYDIGDYLNREEKLKTVSDFESAQNIPWRSITPNEHGDWINVRDPAFAKFMVLGDKDDDKALRLFETYSLGVVTNRDAWAYNFSQQRLAQNMRRMIDFYNAQRAAYGRAIKNAKGGPPAVEEVIDADGKKISWTRNLKGDVRKQKVYEFEGGNIVISMYRPFAKQRLYFSRRFNEMVYQMPKLFPDANAKNLVIDITGLGATKSFSALISDCIPNLHLHDTGQCFPLYYYEEAQQQDDLLRKAGAERHIRRDAITDASLAAFRKTYADSSITKEDLFYYVYGLLHSSEYKNRFEADLKKQLPRIPFAGDFSAFNNAGRELARWHLNYEAVEPYALSQVGELPLGEAALYRVQKMAWARKRVDGKLTDDKTTLIYNSRISLTGIPPEALEYVVNGKPALEWVIERYQVTTDKDSGIVNDPNDWATEHDDPAYILNLVKRVVRVSVETMKIVKNLPPLEERS